MERFAPDLVDVLAFVRVVETGSFARAAERMGLSKPVLSRRVARLEEQLGARLLTRSARGAQPTDIGQAYYARAAAILADLEAAQEVVAQAVTQIAGPIRLTAPLSSGSPNLAPALADFAAAHPPSSSTRVRRIAPSTRRGGYDLAVSDRPLAIRFGRARGSRRCASMSSRATPISSAAAAPNARPTSRAMPSSSMATSNGVSGSAPAGRRSGSRRCCAPTMEICCSPPPKPGSASPCCRASSPRPRSSAARSMSCCAIILSRRARSTR